MYEIIKDLQLESNYLVWTVILLPGFSMLWLIAQPFFLDDVCSYSCTTEHEAHWRCSFFILEVKVEVKTEDDPEPAGDPQQDNQGTELHHEQDGTPRAEQVKVESDKAGNYGRKRPYEENRSYGYYEHREEKRYAFHKL